MQKAVFHIFLKNVMISVAPSAVHFQKYPEEDLVKLMFFCWKLAIGETWPVDLTQDGKEGLNLLQNL